MSKNLEQWLDEFVENGANPKNVTNWPEEVIGPKYEGSYTITENQIIEIKDLQAKEDFSIEVENALPEGHMLYKASNTPDAEIVDVPIENKLYFFYGNNIGTSYSPKAGDNVFYTTSNGFNSTSIGSGNTVHMFKKVGSYTEYTSILDTDLDGDGYGIYDKNFKKIYDNDLMDGTVLKAENGELTYIGDFPGSEYDDVYRYIDGDFVQMSIDDIFYYRWDDNEGEFVMEPQAVPFGGSGMYIVSDNGSGYSSDYLDNFSVGQTETFDLNGETYTITRTA